MKRLFTKIRVRIYRSTQVMLVVALLIASSIASAQVIRYVRPGAVGTGSSWDHAAGDLQAIINVSGVADQVWVSAGTYQPGAGQSFSMKSGVKIYGGFPATGNPVMADRNWGVNEVILQGNGSSVVKNANVTSDALLDGFTITGGHSAGIDGGGISNVGCSLKLMNLIVRDNTSEIGGSGIMNQNSSVVIINAVIKNNNSGQIGGGLLNNDSNTDVINCTFIENSARYFCGGVLNLDMGNLYRLNIHNTIIWANSEDGEVSQGGNFITTGIGVTFFHSIINYGISIYPYSDGGGNTDAYPQFADEPNGDFRLKPNSPAISSGDNDVYLAAGGSNQDVEGGKRIFGRRIDMGAYEFQSSPTLPIRYVRAGASGNGVSWQFPSGDLQEMINESSAGNEIWVTKGTYMPNRKASDLNTITPGSRENAFVLKSGVKIYGGFEGNEGQMAQRNFNQQESILSGEMNSGNKSYHVVVAVGTESNPIGNATTLNGFTIQAGNANNNSQTLVNEHAVSNSNGGGIYNYNSSPYYVNIKLSGNNASNIGGGIFNWSANAICQDMAITNNTAGSGGGAASYLLSPTFFNVKATGNSATWGGGFYNVQSSQSLVGVLISGNSANYGGAIYNAGGSVSLLNATISANTGHAVYNTSDQCEIVLRNSIVYGNEAGVRGGLQDFRNSLVQGTEGTSGNMAGDIDPLFVDPLPPGLSNLGNYTLQPCSPVINTGNNGPLSPPFSKDLAGNSRLYDNTVDLGAYEYQGVIRTGADRLALNASSNTFQSESGKTYRLKTQGEICRSIAVIQSGGQSAVTGEIALSTWIDASVQSYKGAYYVQRHYDISPTVEPDKATATITLYFTQPEFTAFNSATASKKIPAAPDDVTGKTNLRIYQYHGKATGGTGPGSYSGSPVTIDPSDDEIIWNKALERWEVTFDVTGFSGFFAGSESTPLPVKLVSFEGKTNDKQSVDLKWVVAEQSGILEYVVEYSADGRSFSEVGRVGASQQMQDVYEFESSHPFGGDKAYYRLRILEVDATAFSRIIGVNAPETAGPLIYPTPARDNIWLKGQKISGSKVQLINMQGFVVKTFDLQSDVQQLDISTLPCGTYILQLPYGISRKVIKQ